MKLKTIILALLVAIQLPVAAQKIEFSTPYTISQELQPASSEIITYRKAAHALSAVLDSSANYVSLSGEWRFMLLDGQSGGESSISSTQLDKNSAIESWGEGSAKLPLAWQMAGVGKATYSEKAYPFLKATPSKGNFPTPNSGQCALYARDFSVPFDFTDRKLYFTIGAASSKVTLYINGKKVGFATDSKNPARFDISEFVERGRNRAHILVEQFNEASWVQDASGWRLSGINRDIYLFAQPKIRMRDALVSTSLDPTYTNGLLESALLLKTELLNTHTVRVYYDLYDTKGVIIRKENRDVTVGMRKEDTVRFNSAIPNVEKWTSETPKLYTIVYSVKREGRMTEFAAVKVGFRSVEIEGNKLLVNGIAPTIKGVNFEEVNTTSGNTLNYEEVKRELLAMRKIGVNAIRTGSYPLPQFFYNLTDSIGFYVFNIANSNTQGLSNSTIIGGSLANDPRWSDVFVQRAVTAYERTKRNPSVIAVGLGEDAGNGYSMYEAYNAIKNRNKNCVVVYDGAGAEWNTDIVMPLYPTNKEIEKMGKIGILQPIIAARIESIEQYAKTTNTQGAFIDRWQSATIKNSEVKSFERLEDNYRLSTLPNGEIEQSSAKSSILEIEQYFANADIEIIDAKEGLVRVHNRMQYSNLNSFDIRYRVINRLKPGKWVAVTIDCPAAQSREITLASFGETKELEVEISNIYSVMLKTSSSKE